LPPNSIAGLATRQAENRETITITGRVEPAIKSAGLRIGTAGQDVAA